MTPVVEIPLWLLLPYYLVKWFFWLACAIVAAVLVALILIGRLGYRVGQRIEDERLGRQDRRFVRGPEATKGPEATTEV